MPTSRRLRRLFRTITATSLAAAGSACSGSNVEPGFDRSRFPISICTSGSFDVLGAITPATPVDYLAVRNVVPWLDADGGIASPTFSPALGTPCASASDIPACMAALGSLPTDVGWDSGEGGWSPTSTSQLAFTRGDQVGLVTNHAELVDFVGPVDSANEAAALALFGPEPVLRYRVDCTGTNARETSRGFELVLTSGSACGEGTHVDESRVLVAPDGTVTVLETRLVERGDPNCVIGRLTDGVFLSKHVGVARERSRSSEATLAARLAEMASLEAAAVVAFERLARELARLGAPAELIARAERSARDEVRHARVVGAIATRRGGVVEPIEIGDLPERDLLAIALENAVEGTVRETYGAVVATYQARAAQDRELAALFATIARDETRHASLSLDLARWLDTQLSANERSRVEAARADAARSLFADLAIEPDEATRERLGLPDAARAAQLFTATFPAVWSEPGES